MICLVKKAESIHHEVVGAIRDLGSDQLPICVTNPEEVVGLIDPRIPSLIVSGQIFRWRMTGLELAQSLKGISSNVLFVMWSHHSMTSPDIDAYVSKHANAIDVVSRLFANYRPGMGIDELIITVPFCAMWR